MHKYRLISKKGEGTFSEVLKAQSIKNGKYLAIKCMKNHFDSIDQVNNLREIQALRRLSPHPNIIKLYEVLYDQPTGRLALVFELMDMNDEIRQLILSSHSAGEIRKAARAGGLSSLSEDGWRVVGEGETTVDEVLRVTKDEKRNGSSLANGH